MKKYFKIILLILFTSIMQVYGQSVTCVPPYAYISYGSLSLNVVNNGCTKQWDLTSSATVFSNDSPYCSGWCYQYDLYKVVGGTSTHIEQDLVSSSPYTFHVNYDQPGSYHVLITTRYLDDVNACNNGIWTIVTDQTVPVSLTSFCNPNSTYSNVSSSNGTLPSYTRTTNYIVSNNTVTVNTGTNVSFYSQGYIELNPGFLAESGSVFVSTIQTCSSSASCSQRFASNQDIMYDDNYNILVKEGQINVYPNPTSGVLNIELNFEKEKDTEITVLNTIGKEIYFGQSGLIQAGKTEIDLSNQTPGMYVVKVKSDNDITYKKVIISK